MDEEKIVRAEIKRILEKGEAQTPRVVKHMLAENLGLQDIDKWKPVIQDELKPYLPDKASKSSQGDLKRKPEDSASNPKDAKSAKLDFVNEGLELSETRKVTVSDFKGKKLVNIREYYQDASGEMKPGRKGLALSVESWSILEENLEGLSQALESEDLEHSVDLGSSRRAAVSKYKGNLNVDLREVYEKNGEILPGKKGISLSAAEWRILASHGKLIGSHLPKAAGSAKQEVAKCAGVASPGAAKAASSNQSQDVVELSKNRRASISEFKGTKLLSLREYYEKDGQMLPGKKGVSLTKAQAEVLLEKKDELSSKLGNKQEVSFPLGNRKRAGVSSYKGSWSVDVREFYEKDGEEKPGPKGLSMPQEQWNVLTENLKPLVEQL